MAWHPPNAKSDSSRNHNLIKYCGHYDIPKQELSIAEQDESARREYM